MGFAKNLYSFTGPDGKIFVNTNGGTVVETNLATLAQTVIASGGTRGNLFTVDPANGWLLLTQGGDIVRLTAPSGGGFGTVREPGTPFLLGSGLVGLAGTARRRRRR